MANQLTARLDKGRVVVTGDKTRVKLPRDSGPHKFAFNLDDQTGLNVRFSALSADESQQCPPRPGINTDQIVDVDIDGEKASFKDSNSGPGRDISYAWTFACDDPSQTPEFDPVITNGGGGNI